MGKFFSLRYLGQSTHLPPIKNLHLDNPDSYRYAKTHDSRMQMATTHTASRHVQTGKKKAPSSNCSLITLTIFGIR